MAHVWNPRKDIEREWRLNQRALDFMGDGDGGIRIWINPPLDRAQESRAGLLAIAPFDVASMPISSMVGAAFRR
jgi:hypothetical protein